MTKRLFIVLGILVCPLILGLLITYQVIKVDWISFMEIQPSYTSMEDPLPLPPESVPVQGAAYVPGLGAPVNPVPPMTFSATGPGTVQRQLRPMPRCRRRRQRHHCGLPAKQAGQPAARRPADDE